MRPFGVERERIAVEVRRHVAGEAGIRVLAPGSAETVGLLVDDDVIAARLAQPDGGEDARHPGPDDSEAERWSERQRLAFTTRGKALKRRTTRLLSRAGGCSGSSAKCSVRARSRVRTICASRRARGAPTQKWIPRPNARWCFGAGRSSTTSSGRSYSAGSRLAAPQKSSTVDPAAMGTPRTSVARVA